MSAIALTTAGLLAMGGCTWGQAEPEGEGEQILMENIEGEVEGVVGAYVSYGVDDVGSADLYGLERVDEGWILAVSMQWHDEILDAAIDLHGPRDRLGVESEASGPRFTLARSKFSDLGGYRGKLRDGYFELSGIPRGRYLVCYAKSSIDHRASYRVTACSRNVEIDPPDALRIKKVSSVGGGGLFVDVEAPPPVDGAGWW